MSGLLIWAVLLGLSLDEANDNLDWLGWGGTNGDFRVPKTVELVETFGEWGPKELWRRELGDGYSSLLYKDGRLYSHHRDEKEEVVSGLDAINGASLWEYRYEAGRYEDLDPSYGEGPNATPLIIGNRLVTAGIAGDLCCFDLDGGELVWERNLHERYGRQKRQEEYGFSASPLAYEDAVLVLVGGEEHGVVALDIEDGGQIWGSPPSRISYAQPTMIQVDDKPQMVFFSPTEVIGLNPEDGSFLWRYPVKCFTENNLTPALHLGERFLWVASQLDGGTRVLELPPWGSDDPPKVVWESRTIKQAHWNSFCDGDYVYGSLGGNAGSFLGCVNWRTGKVEWKYRGFHLAKGVLCDERFYFLDENGQLGIARFTPEEVTILDSHQVTERVSWTAPTLVGTELFIRDRKHVIAIDLAPSAYEDRQ